jgi:hypothetical protein
MRDEAAIVALLERCARLDPCLIRAIGGYELEPPVFDLTWVIRLENSEPEPRSDHEAAQ